MEGFMLYTAQYPAIKTMSQEQKGDLLDALYAYAIDGAQISAEADPMVQMAFAFIRDAIDRAQGKYEAKCERNRQTALKREQKKREAQTYTNVQEHDAGNATEHKREEKAQTCTNVHERGKTTRTCTNVNERAPQSTNVHECSPIKTKQNETKQNKTNPSIERGGKEKEKESPQAAVSFSALSPTPTGEESDGSEDAEAQRRRVELDAECTALKNYWNEQAEKTGSLVRRVTLMTDARKALVRARLAEYDNDESVLRLAVDKVIASNYANGENPRSWVATFDWLMVQENFVKTLEGNYDNEPRKAKQNAKSASRPQAAGCDLTEAIAEAQQDNADKDRKMKERIEGLVRLVNRDPQSSARKALEYYERNGTLKRLGIIWEPLLHQA